MKHTMQVKYRGKHRIYHHNNHEYTVTPMDGGYDVGVDGDFLAHFDTLDDAEDCIVTHQEIDASTEEVDEL